MIKVAFYFVYLVCKMQFTLFVFLIYGQSGFIGLFTNSNSSAFLKVGYYRVILNQYTETFK
jgi:hypothetical protein